MAIKKYDVNDFISTDSSLKPNFNRKDLEVFMLTLEDLPEHVKQDVYTKLFDKAVDNELYIIAEHFRAEVVSKWIRNHEYAIRFNDDIREFTSKHMYTNDYEILAGYLKEPFSNIYLLKIIFATKFLNTRKQISITVDI